MTIEEKITINKSDLEELIVKEVAKKWPHNQTKINLYKEK